MRCWVGTTLWLSVVLVACGQGDVELSEQTVPQNDRAELHESSLWDAADWTRIGEQLPPPRSVTVDRFLPNVAYVASTAGVFVSWSFGEHWSRAQLVGQAYGVEVDPNHPGRALAYSDTALFETRDAGLSWRRLAVTLPGPLLAIAPGDANTLWAGGRDVRFVFRSVDRGAHWTQLDFGGPGACCLDFVALSPTELYANAFFAQLQRSFDGGESWPLSTFADLYMVPKFAVDRRHPEVVYAGNNVPYGPTGLRKSTDGARTWTSPNAELASARVADVAVSSADGRLFVATRAEDGPAVLHISSDGGHSFAATPEESFAGAQSMRIVPHPSWPCIAFAITDRGLYRSANGGGTCR